MAERDHVELTFEKGLYTGGDALRLPPGAVSSLRGWYYRLGDQSRIWKVPGRQAAGSLGTSTDVIGLKHLQYEDEADWLVAYANSRLYEAEAALSGLSFSTAKDANGDDFEREGDWLRALHDGQNQWWLLTGAASRALVRDRDGNWRFAGMLAPAQIETIEGVTSTPTLLRPTSGTNDTSPGFIHLEWAYDGNKETAASAHLHTTDGWHTAHWTFDSGTDVSGFILNVELKGEEKSRQNGKTFNGKYDPSGLADWHYGGYSFGTSVVRVFVSEDGGTNWRKIYDGAATRRQTVQTTIGSGVDSGSVRVKISAMNIGEGRVGAIPVTAYVYEIWMSSGSPDGTKVPPGTYNYVVTEIYRRTLSDGQTVEVESAPCPVRSITVTESDTYYGIRLTLPDKQNLPEHGYPSDLVHRRIYRSTSTGSWPDMGMIAEIGVEDETFLDDFTVPYDSLGTPPLFVVFAGALAVDACGTPPTLLDACLYQGAIVGISAEDTRRIYWSLPGWPEYWPTTVQTVRLLPTERQDRLKAIISLGDVMLLFSRNQVFRIRGLPFANQPSFDLTDMEVTILSPAIGLAGTPSSVCLAHAFDGYPLVFWVADNGIWMTDGGLPSERGVGVMKVTLSLDWDRDVDTSRLDETVLAYDTANQILRFQYYDPDGNRREIWFHVAPEHWVQFSESSKPVPKASGPHVVSDNSKRLVDLAPGEHSAIFRMWSLSSEGKVYVEMRGAADEAEFAGLGGDIVSVLETGWIYPAGPLEYAEVLRGACYHSDWGDHTLVLELRGRTDRTGTSQHLVQSAIPLTGERLSTFEAARSGGGQSMKFTLTHTGQATGAIGALALKIRPAGPVEG